MKCFVVLLMIVVVWGRPVDAQELNLRYELGKRVERYELLWESSSREERAASTAAMEKAVQEFFRLDLVAAAKSLDDAWLSMLPSPTELQSTTAPVSLSALPRLVDANQPVVDLTLKSIYPQTEPDWKDSDLIEIEISPLDSQSEPEKQSRKFPLTSLPIQWRWELPSMKPGDYRVTGSVHHGGISVPVVGTQITIVKDKQLRLDAINEWIEENKRAPKSTSICTARMLGKQLVLAERGKNFECDLPLSWWLSDFESIVKQSHRTDGPTERWQVLTDGKAEQVVRLQLPSKPIDKTSVIFAFHGAGGSENMFFEAYGAGRLIELARSRNWVVVCPRQGLSGLAMSTESMLPLIEKELGVAFERVFLVGHSMGAAQAMEQFSKSQDRITAVAAIGGGGRIPPKTEATLRTSLYLSAGERDFGRGGVLKLRDGLKALSCKVDYSEYKDVEHLTIVQACLDELFQFLDRQ